MDSFKPGDLCKISKINLWEFSPWISCWTSYQYKNYVKYCKSVTTKHLYYNKKFLTGQKVLIINPSLDKNYSEILCKDKLYVICTKYLKRI